MTLDAPTISAIGTAIVSLAGLITAIHAHGKSTQATSDANSSGAKAAALERVLVEALPQLVSALGVRLPVSLPTFPPPPMPAVTAVSSEPAWAVQLKGWLAEQHRAETGSYPHEGGPITDFSKVIAQIAMLELKKT